jgi:6-hydroxytryprostatin B O-methyltransferase
VQDLPEVIQNASAGLDDDDVRSRITFQPYDFFDPQPVCDADVYMLRIVLHDWPDDKAREILRNVRAAMKPSARLLIVETVLPQPGTVNPFEDSYMRWRDLQMRTVCNGRERYLDEWTRLLADADDQWEVKSVVRPFNSWYSIIEVALRG